MYSKNNIIKIICGFIQIISFILPIIGFVLSVLPMSLYHGRSPWRDHRLSMIASDGAPFEEFKADVFNIYPGE